MKFKQLAVGMGMLAVAVALLCLFPYKKENGNKVYQLEVVGEHRIKLYDGERLVGEFPYNEDEMNPTYLDNAIIIDTQYTPH